MRCAIILQRVSTQLQQQQPNRCVQRHRSDLLHRTACFHLGVDKRIHLGWNGRLRALAADAHQRCQLLGAVLVGKERSQVLAPLVVPNTFAAFPDFVHLTALPAEGAVIRVKHAATDRADAITRHLLRRIEAITAAYCLV